MIDIWIALRLSSTSNEYIEHLREILADRIPTQFNEEKDPHISVLPGITIPEEAYDRIEAVTERCELPDQKVHIAGLDLHRYDHPYVISLAASISLHALREQLLEAVYETGGRAIYPPVSPHITLFKTADRPELAQKFSGTTIKNLHETVSQLNQNQSVKTSWSDDTYEFSLQKI